MAKTGRPKTKDNPGYADLMRLKKIKALMENDTLKKAYKQLHPEASDRTAEYSGSRMLTPEIFDEIKRLMGFEKVVVADKEILEKVLFLVISRWMQKEEKTADMIAAVRELTKLVPEFKDKLQIEDISTASEEEIDRKLRSFGYDPRVIPN